MRSDKLKTQLIFEKTRFIVNFAIFYMLLIGMWYLNKSSLIIEELFYLGKSTNASEGPILKTFTIFSFTYQPQ